MIESILGSFQVLQDRGDEVVGERLGIVELLLRLLQAEIPMRRLQIEMEWLRRITLSATSAQCDTTLCLGFNVFHIGLIRAKQTRQGVEAEGRHCLHGIKTNQQLDRRKRRAGGGTRRI